MCLFGRKVPKPRVRGAKPTAYRLHARSVTYSATAAAVTILWRYISVMPLPLPFTFTQLATCNYIQKLPWYQGDRPDYRNVCYSPRYYTINGKSGRYSIIAKGPERIEALEAQKGTKQYMAAWASLLLLATPGQFKQKMTCTASQ